MGIETNTPLISTGEVSSFHEDGGRLVPRNRLPNCDGVRLRMAVRRASKSECRCIFRGTITEIAKQTVHFQVARVWKGNVGKVFTMPELRETGACVGFGSSHLRVGNDLLVYASQVKGAYVTDICTRTQFAQDAGEDFVELGLGLPPLELRQSHFLIRALVGIALFGIGTWMLFKWAMQ